MNSMKRFMWIWATLMLVGIVIVVFWYGVAVVFIWLGRVFDPWAVAGVVLFVVITGVMAAVKSYEEEKMK